MASSSKSKNLISVGWLNLLLIASYIPLLTKASFLFDDHSPNVLSGTPIRPLLTLKEAPHGHVHDPCQTKQFIGDVALTEKDLYEISSRSLSYNVTTKPIPVWEVEESAHNISGYNKSLDLLKTILTSRRQLLRHHVTLNRVKRAATADPERIWPHGVIPYTIDYSVITSEVKRTILKAMRHWENYTCISFVEREPHHRSYINFTVKPCGCCSFVGMRSPIEPQAISIGKNCDKEGIIIHELGHVVGYWHEHTRPDRDEHVDIFLKNVSPGQEFNFKKMNPNEVDSLGEPYDYHSIMHYAKHTFGKYTKDDTILPKVCCPRPAIGQRLHLSAGDKRQTKKLYKCPACGQSLLSPKGTFFSPNFNDSAKQSDRQKSYLCRWRISFTDGKQVRLNISHIDIPFSRSCRFEYLEIRDGYYVGSPLLGRFCGKNLPEVIKSTKSRLWIEYRKSDRTDNKGFKASYDAICGGEFKEDKGEGVLSSPNYPELYSPNEDCTWIIRVPKGFSVAFSFMSFEMEKHDSCVYDYLEIRDGDTADAPLLDKLCGLGHRKPIQSTDNKMFIKFKSDNSVSKPGFTAVFQKEYDECKTPNHGCSQICVNTLGNYKCKCEIGYELREDGRTCEDACGGLINKTSGIIQSPNYPRAYLPDKTCMWRIVAEPRTTIFINFTSFDIEGRQKDCQYDFLNIYADASQTRKLATLCGNTLPEPITSTSNELIIEFFSDGTVQSRGFQLKFITDHDECAINKGGCQHLCRNTIGSYECYCHQGYILSDRYNCKENVDRGCKEELEDPEGEIYSPEWPSLYPAGQSCQWKLRTVPPHRIKLNFLEIVIEHHQDCSYDYVEAFDGADDHSPLLGRYCGNLPPKPVLSTKNSLTLTFHSDASIQRKGFKARYSTVCSGTVEVTTTPLNFYSHVRFGGAIYDNNLRCRWLFVNNRTEQYTMALEFMSFDLETENTCVYDAVEVYDGANKRSKMLGRFCGNKIPPRIIAPSEVLSLHFRTDENTGAKGFHAKIYLILRSSIGV